MREIPIMSSHRKTGILCAYIRKMSFFLKIAYFPLFSLKMLENVFQAKSRSSSCSRVGLKNILKALDFTWNMFSSILRENKAKKLFQENWCFPDVVGKCIYQCRTLCINYTTYNVGHGANTINTGSYPNIMVNFPKTGSDAQLYWYAHVIGVFHALISSLHMGVEDKSLCQMDFPLVPLMFNILLEVFFVLKLDLHIILPLKNLRSSWNFKLMYLAFRLTLQNLRWVGVGIDCDK